MDDEIEEGSDEEKDDNELDWSPNDSMSGAVDGGVGANEVGQFCEVDVEGSQLAAELGSAVVAVTPHNRMAYNQNKCLIKDMTL